MRESKSRAQQYSASGWSWMNLKLCKGFKRVKDFKCLFQLPRFAKRELCWKFESRHSPDLREAECCLYLQHEHISRVSFLVCLYVFACTPVHSNSPTTSTVSLACFAGALTKQLSDSFVSPKHVQRVCLILTPSTRVFHSGSGAGLHPWIIQLSQLRMCKHYGGS